MLIYWFYGRTHSPLVNRAEAAARSGVENLGNLLKMAGYMLLFNGFCFLLLGLLTEWGVIKEELAKWHEVDSMLSRIGLHISPEIADRYGIYILIAGAISLVLGVVLGRGSQKR